MQKQAHCSVVVLAARQLQTYVSPHWILCCRDLPYVPNPREAHVKGNIFHITGLFSYVLPWLVFLSSSIGWENLKGERTKICLALGRLSHYSWAVPLHSFPLPRFSLMLGSITDFQEGFIWSYLCDWLHGVGSAEFHRPGQTATALGQRSARLTEQWITTERSLK